MKVLRRLSGMVLCAALAVTCISLPGSVQSASAEESSEETDSSTVSYTYEYEGHTLTYEIEDDAVTVTGCADTDAETTVTELTIPEEIDGMTVTGIGGSAFYGFTALTQITLPDTITEMGTSAFYGCESLTSIDLPDGITEIGRRTFRNCTGLVSIDFPESLNIIEMYAFYNCEKLEELNFPDHLTRIYEYAFYNCTNITYVRLPASEVTISDNNFLQSQKVETIEYAEGCTRPYTYDSWQNGTTFVSSAKTLILPSTLTSLETGGAGYSGTISNDYFSAFSSLEEIVFPNGHEDYTTYGGAIYTADMETLLIVPHGLSEYEIADTTVTIAYGAFYSCSRLTTIEIPESVTTLESRAINSCTSLQTLEIPETVTSIAEGAVSSCSALTYFTYYDDGIFYEYSDADEANQLTQLEIHDYTSEAAEVTSDIFNIFVSNSNNGPSQSSYTSVETGLQTIIFPDSTESIASGFFDGMSALTAIVVDENNSTYYTENGVLYQYTDGEVSESGNPALSLIRYPLALGYVEYADNLVSIGEQAFYSCSAIKYFDFPSTLTEVGAQAFYRCTGITVTFEEGLTTIDDEAFMNCLNSDILVPESLTSIGENAFYTTDQSLTLYCYPDSYAETYAIENEVVYADRSTYGIEEEEETEDTEEPSSEETEKQVSKQTKGAAVGTKVTVSGLTYKVTSSSAVTVTGSTKKNASKVTIPATVRINGKSYKVTQIAASAFAKNKKLKTVVIGKNVKKIGKKAFYNCKNLKKITLKGKNLKTIGAKALKGTAQKATVKCPKAKKAAYKKLLKKAGLSAKAKVK